MRLLFLSKRRPMGRDLLSRPYGRFFHLPRVLANKGYDVRVLLMDYGSGAVEAINSGVAMRSVGLLPWGPWTFMRAANTLVRDFKPDWLIGFSDTYFGIIAQHFASRYGIKSLVDTYDNYESYLPWCQPLHRLWRTALGKATAVTCAGPQLADLLQQSRGLGDVRVIPMAADPEFVPLGKARAREELGFPRESKLIGYCGSAYKNRGIALLNDIAEMVALRLPGVEIVISGRKEKGLKFPDNVRALGYLPDRQMPALLNALDLVLVFNQESSFGNYSYPVKLYEAMQCRIPLVASDTAAVRWVLRGDERFLASVGNADDFLRKITAMLVQDRIDYGPLPTWEENATELEAVLLGRDSK